MTTLKTILQEYQLMSEFKFGFELECYIPFVTSEYYDEYDKKIAKKSFNNQFSKILGQEGSFSEESSLTSDYEGYFGVEWNSPPMSITPKNIQNTIKALSDLNFITDQTCGFHVHISYPFISYSDTAWFIFNLALNDKLRNKWESFEDISFITYEFSNTEMLDSIKNYYDPLHPEVALDFIDNNKYGLFRIHPQGTLEWRGPRNFLDELDLIKRFFLKLLENVKSLKETLELKSFKGLSRTEFDSIINSIRNKNYIAFGDSDKIIKKFSKSVKKEDIAKIYKLAPWLKVAQFTQADIKIDGNKIVWENGIWESGTWKDGVWKNGNWLDGTWEDGVWEGGNWNHGIWEDGKWKTGVWERGIWLNGEWLDGIWKNGTWRNGTWFNGAWRNGTWKRGTWKKGIWLDGDWFNGTWEDGNWEGGNWEGGVFKGGTRNSSSSTVES